MKITKLGHCCLLIENKATRILTDPGVYSTAQNELKNIDAVLFTHEHPDHYHVESLKEIIKNNSQAQIITNVAVAKLLDEEKITYSLIGNKENKQIKDILVEAFEEQHAIVYPGLPRVLNTGYLIGETLLYPGDALIKPKKEVKILAAPMAGPWIKFGEAIDYIKAIKPQKAFPVHDASLSPNGTGFMYQLAKQLLEQEKIDFMIVENEKEFET